MADAFPLLLHESESWPALPQSTLSSSSPPWPSFSAAELISSSLSTNRLGFGPLFPFLFSDSSTMWSRQITASLQLLKEPICIIWRFKGKQGPGVCCFVSSYHRRQRQIFGLDACVSPLTCTPFMLSTHHSWRKRGGRHHDVFVKYVSCFFFSLASLKSYHLHLTCPL